MSETTPRTWGLGIIRDERGLVLLLRRQDEVLWILPGGSAPAEAGESADEACRRVIREETGILVAPHAALSLDRVPADERGPGEYCTVFDCWVVEYRAPAILLDSGLSGYRWVKADRTGEYLGSRHSGRARLALGALKMGAGAPCLVSGKQLSPRAPQFSPPNTAA